MMALFLWGKFRYDVAAVMALLAAVAAGIVKPADAFRGFSDDIVIIVGSALVLSGAVQRSGAIERLMRRLQKHVTTVRSQLLLLAASVGLDRRCVPDGEEVGHLAIRLSDADGVRLAARRADHADRHLAQHHRQPRTRGNDGAALPHVRLCAGRTRPHRRRADLPALRIPAASARPARGADDGRGARHPRLCDRGEDRRTVGGGGRAGGGLHRRHEQEVTISMFLRDGIRATPAPGTVLREGDILILGGAPDSLERAIARDKLDFVGTSEAPESEEGEEIGVIEAVVSAGSPLVGGTAGSLMLRQRFGINLIAVSRQGERIVRRMPNVIFRAGDVIVLQGPLGGLPQTLNELGALPLAERELRLGSVRKGLLPIAILAVAMAATATGVVPVTIAFFAAAAAVVITGALPVRDAYEHVEWPILIMLGALIPVSDTLRATGVTEIIGNWLSLTAASLPPWGAVALIMAAAMAVTPFLNNAATVLVMAPIAATFAGDLGLRPEAFLMATAVGAGCDFLTPIGHQCNTLVMGPGGYRFSDYARLGAPLSLLVLVVGTPLILWVWPVA
ncbi:citrate transporter domain-containing protein [Ditylenchus destructor]|uniref:Citrate transporter domain-containing protein n=1 Tax=Ditylenchus destructor TaxID=166010 RepID=A0AAD4MFI7_9BILA|nr:citrate transporter domain-containing protein [Ditylenchus destructor]